MWLQQKDWTLASEAEFNLLNSQQDPHCCVCSVLRPAASNRQENTTDSTAVLLPEQLFGVADVDNKSSHNNNNTSILLRCSSCRVCVHAKCYGVAEAAPAMNWLCKRCERNVETAKCCLCLQRGGALKATTDGRWAHVLCTLCFPGVYFSNPASREPIVVDQLGREKVVLDNCFYCSGRPDCGNVFYHGVCLLCAGPRCRRAFHPMCGLVNGVRFSLDHNGQLAGNCCSTYSRPSVKKKILQHSPVGQKVYAKHPDGRYRIVS